MRKSVFALALALSVPAFAQQPADPYAPGTPSAPPPGQAYPPGQQAPPPGYQYYPQQPPAPPAAAPQTRLLVSTTSDPARAALRQCVDAYENGRLETARTRCGESIAADSQLALAQLFLALSSAGDVSRIALEKAVELTKAKVTTGERLFVDVHRVMRGNRPQDAGKLLDLLVVTLPQESRAVATRGYYRLRHQHDVEGAIADFKKAAELDPKQVGPHIGLHYAYAERDQLDEALAEAKRYVEMAPNEPRAHALVAELQLRRGEIAEATQAAKKAMALDSRNPAARAAWGDALLFSGKAKDARREYAGLAASEDPATHHKGALREARSWLFEGRYAEAEKALAAEAETAKKTRRPGDEIDTLQQLARIQIDRSALTEAGQTLRNASTLLAAAETASTIDDGERRRIGAELLYLRSLVLGAVGERQLAEARADEYGSALKALNDPRATQRMQALKGWIAARNGDDKNAVVDLAMADRATLKMALALASQRAGEPARARSLMEELGKATVNDLEVALTRPRANGWLKQNPARAAASPN